MRGLPPPPAGRFAASVSETLPFRCPRVSQLQSVQLLLIELGEGIARGSRTSSSCRRLLNLVINLAVVDAQHLAVIHRPRVIFIRVDAEFIETQLRAQANGPRFINSVARNASFSPIVRHRDVLICRGRRRAAHPDRRISGRTNFSGSHPKNGLAFDELGYFDV